MRRFAGACDHQGIRLVNCAPPDGVSTVYDKTDLHAITATTEEYFLGLHRRDIASLRRAFHPAAFLFGHLAGKLAHSSLEQWLEAVESRPIPAESGESFDMRIVAIDMSNEVAVVKVNELYRGLRFTDYLTMLKVEGKWSIVNKAFHHD